MKRPGYGKYGVAAKADRTYNGIVYASKAEAKRAFTLDLELRAGAITSWKRQPVFELGPDKVIYRADFQVVGVFGSATEWVEEIKGCETREFKRKMKLYQKYGTLPLVIRYARGVTRWVHPVRGQRA